MPYVPHGKAALLIPSGSHANPTARHLFAVLTDRCPDNRHLLVSFSTIREDRFHDPTCIVEPGEHPFLAAKSFIEYRSSLIVHTGHLTKMVDLNYYAVKDDISDELHKKICAGLLQSAFSPRLIKNYLAAQQRAGRA